MDDPYIGTIVPWPSPKVPDNWCECDGRLLNISEYQGLFALFGTRYGGNGTTTFGIPDLRGRAVVGAGTAIWGTSYPLASTGGAASAAITQAQIPAHTHTLNKATNASGNYKVSSAPVGSNSVTGNRLGAGTAANQVVIYNNAAPNTAIATASGPYTVNLSTSGTAQTVATRPPYLGLRFIVALLGIFPTQN